MKNRAINGNTAEKVSWFIQRQLFLNLKNKMTIGFYPFQNILVSAITDISKLLQEPNQTPSRDFSRTINRTFFSFYWNIKSRTDAGPGNLASHFLSVFTGLCFTDMHMQTNVLTCGEHRLVSTVWTHLWGPDFGVTTVLTRDAASQLSLRHHLQSTTTNTILCLKCVLSLTLLFHFLLYPNHFWVTA